MQYAKKFFQNINVERATLNNGKKAAGGPLFPKPVSAPAGF
jgi:hypothetical protein